MLFFSSIYPNWNFEFQNDFICIWSHCVEDHISHIAWRSFHVSVKKQFFIFKSSTWQHSFLNICVVIEIKTFRKIELHLFWNCSKWENLKNGSPQTNIMKIAILSSWLFFAMETNKAIYWIKTNRKPGTLRNLWRIWVKW